MENSKKTKLVMLEKLLADYYKDNKLNGSVLVADKGEVILKKGFGYANFEWDIPNDVDTRHRIGSVTKQFTAMLILQLVEEGKIMFQGKLCDYLPNYRADIGEKVSIHQLLTHTSGIPNYTEIPGFIENEAKKHIDIDEFINNYCSFDLEFEPGTEMVYSNSGYYILGKIIENVTGKPYDEVLQEKILFPAGMFNTGHDSHERVLKKRSSGYIVTEKGILNADYIDAHAAFSAGAMYSTVEDLYLWDQCLYTDKLLSKEYFEYLKKPELNNYSYGWVTGNIPMNRVQEFLVEPFTFTFSNEGENINTAIMEHEGGIPGHHSMIVRIIDKNQLIVLLNNSGHTCLSEIASKVFDALNNN